MKLRLNRSLIELKTLGKMINVYCFAHHGTRGKLCAECSALYMYASKKYRNCIFGNQKPVCSNCDIHCYESKERQTIINVMHFSAPRMIFRHPLLTLTYLYFKFFN